MTFGHHSPVFVPKVKHISHQEQFRHIILYFIQELHQYLFPLQAGSMVWRTEMKIGKKVNLIISRNSQNSLTGITGNIYLTLILFAMIAKYKNKSETLLKTVSYFLQAVSCIFLFVPREQE